MAIVRPLGTDPTREQRALVRRILRIRPDVTPAQLVGILGGKLLDASGASAADPTRYGFARRGAGKVLSGLTTVDRRMLSVARTRTATVT